MLEIRAISVSNDSDVVQQVQCLFLKNYQTKKQAPNGRLLISLKNPFNYDIFLRPA